MVVGASTGIDRDDPFHFINAFCALPGGWHDIAHYELRPCCGWTAQKPEPREAYETVHTGKRKRDTLRLVAVQSKTKVARST